MARKEFFQDKAVWLIENGDSKAWVAPQYGGRLLRWTLGDHEIIRWPADADWSKPAKVRGGNPLLFPFIARHMVDGKQGFWKDGDTIREMPMHGFARDSDFEILDITADHRILMRLANTEATRNYYPFDFYFDVEIALQPRGLCVLFRTTNRDKRPLPYYAGHHFYFNIPHNERDKWTLEIPCNQIGHQNPDGSITFHPTTTIKTALDDAELIDRFHIMDDPSPVFLTHESGKPRFRFILDNPETLHWGAVTTWTQDPNSDFYCVEPWLGLPNAIHHEHGLRYLDPGKSEEAMCIIEAEI
ncbi:MAG: aldose epimerase [Verrucomicrobiota bacterium]